MMAATTTSGATSSVVVDRREFIEAKMNEIYVSKNKSEVLALDLEINLLICAAQSYKHESALRPFPSTLLSDSNNDKNYSLLLNALLAMPPVLEWRSRIGKLTDDQLAIIYWILMHRNYHLELSSLDQEKLKEMTKYTQEFTKPTYIFEVKHTDEKNRKFESIIEATRVSMGITESSQSLTSLSYHGTRMDNMYSILHNGLLSHLNKNSLYGEGTYLSQEPIVSLHFSPSCKSWDHSLIGQRMSALLVCETINDPAHVKTGENDTSNTQSTGGGGASQSNPELNKLNSNMPDKYFLVRNNEYVRVKYVVLFAEKYKVKKRNNFMQFINEHRFVLFLIAYSLLLVFISLMNSRAFHKYIKTSYRKLSSFLLGEASASPYYD